MSPMCTGVNTPGIDMLARMLRTNEPWVSTTSLSVTKSVATQANCLGRSRKKLMLSV